MSARPGWDEYFMEIAHTVATRATCPRALGGRRARARASHSHDRLQRRAARRRALYRGRLHRGQRSLPARNARRSQRHRAGRAARRGLQGATAYCTHQPCVNCSKLLISAGVVKIVYESAYPDPVASELLAEAGVALVRLRVARRRALVTRRADLLLDLRDCGDRRRMRDAAGHSARDASRRSSTRRTRSGACTKCRRRASAASRSSSVLRSRFSPCLASR